MRKIDSYLTTLEVCAAFLKLTVLIAIHFEGAFSGSWIEVISCLPLVCSRSRKILKYYLLSKIIYLSIKKCFDGVNRMPLEANPFVTFNVNKVALAACWVHSTSAIQFGIFIYLWKHVNFIIVSFQENGKKWHGKHTECTLVWWRKITDECNVP